jgi:hypothetical protein
MINITTFGVSLKIIEEAQQNIPSDDFKFCLNNPTGNFFYDPWQLNEELIGTVWETIYNSLPVEKGEARLIKLEGGKSYISHADIDDRYHLNISGVKCYLIDLDNLKMHPLVADGVWYNMDAGRRHTASNFGNRTRYQLVIRHLLKRNDISNPVKVTVVPAEDLNPDSARFIFDDVISPWLNSANKLGTISEFSYNENHVSFITSDVILESFKSFLPKEFQIA